MLTIEIETGNKAFADSKAVEELNHILQEVMRRLAAGHERFYLYDVNGSLVGHCIFRPGREEEE